MTYPANGQNLSPHAQACDDQLVIDRWCGYHGGFVKANKNDFIKHLHVCEIKRCDDAGMKK